VSEFDEGGARRFVVTIRDVTERKRTEAQIRRQQGEMAHVLRVATIERFAAELAHELNQPIAAIANDLEACAIGEPLDTNSPAYDLSPEPYDRRRVIAEPPRGRGMDEPRPVQRAEPRFESTDLSELARAATRWLSHEMEHERIALHLDLDVQRLPVRVDRIQIEQVLVNLLQNAVDAIRDTDTATRTSGSGRRAARTAARWPSTTRARA
jgi:two-component system sensor kinase FixL